MYQPGGDSLYAGPADADLRDVEAINLRYLRYCRGNAAGTGIGNGPVAGVRRLGDAALARLAAVPFLLVSLREHEDAFWSDVLRPKRNADLFEVREAKPGDLDIRIAALAFVWQLCRRNPHTARLVAGAPLEWCEALLRCPLAELIDRCSERPGLLSPRLSADGIFWRRLLTAGVAEDAALRRTAQLAALHTVLARQAPGTGARLPAAACHLAPAATRTGPKPRRR